MAQVAVITGGASGMGYAVAKALADRGGWHLHLLDMNAERGEQATKDINKSTFHKTNVTNYDELAGVFQKVFETEKRLDFVFANAGIVERYSFFEKHDVGKPPPPPDLAVIDINLKSVVNTTWLAQHYFRQSTQSENKNLVMTASCGAFYSVPASPSYAAAKAGVVQLTRSIARQFYKDDGVRVNAICPGTVRTNLLESAAWDRFGDNIFVPIEKISETVLMLIDGEDKRGKRLGDDGQAATNGVSGASKGKLNGEAVELSGTNHYYRDQIGFCDASMAKTMGVTDKSNF